MIHDVNIAFDCCGVIENNREILLWLFWEKEKSRREPSELSRPCILTMREAAVWSQGCFTSLDIFHVMEMTLAAGLHRWHPRCKLQTCLCARRQIERLIWSLESLPLSYSPLIHMFLPFPRGIMDHRADCWPLREGNSETAGHPSQGQTDVQVTWRGSE